MFADGKAKAAPRDEAIVAVRVQPAHGLDASPGDPRADRSNPIRRWPFSSIPVEFVIDVADEPKMKDWAEKAAKVCTRAYPMINESSRATDSSRRPS